MMDLGAGLGMISEEAAVRGANPVAVEPGSGFRVNRLVCILAGRRRHARFSDWRESAVFRQ